MKQIMEMLWLIFGSKASPQSAVLLSCDHSCIEVNSLVGQLAVILLLGKIA